MPNNSYSDQGWLGLDAYHSPGKMAAGFLQQADNCLIRGSDLVSRPGRQGLLTTPHTDPVYLLGPFRRADGTTAITYTSGGKLYRLDKNASASTEIKDAAGASLSLVSANALAARLGKYQYIVDGAGALIRTDLTTGVASPFLTAPTAAPTAALTSMQIDPLTGGTWTPDTLTGAGQVNRLPNSSFSSISGSLPTGYSGYGTDPDTGGSSGQGGNWVNLDTPGEGFYNSSPLANDPVAADSSRYASQFYVATDVVQRDSSAKSTLVIRLLGFSDAAGTNLVASVSREFTVAYSGGQIATVGGVFSVASYSVPILSYQVRYEAGQYNTLGGSTAIFVQNVVAFPFAPALSATNSGGLVKVQQPQQLAYSGGRLTGSRPGEVGSGVGAGGVHLSRDFGSNQNWSGDSNVILGLAKAYGISGLTLSLAFRQNGSATRYYTNPFVISPDGTYATLDISTVPKSVLSSFRYLELVLGGDFAVPAGNGADLFSFGPLTGAGNLSIGYSDYSWVFTEVNGNGDSTLTDVVESNPSAATSAVTPTTLQAEGLLTLPITSTNSTANFKAVYRYGGVFSDVPAVGRLIAVVPAASDVAYGADTRNPYYSWNHATGVFDDNTPDSYILQAGVFPNAGTPLVNGRDAPPAGAQAICAYHGRLIIAVGSVLYISWLLTPTNPSAMYFTLAQTPGDPNEAIKGASFPIGGQFDNDPIQALVPHNTDVVIEKHTAKSLLQGYSGENFAVTDYLQGAGFGTIAPRANLLMGNYEASLCSSGPFRFTGASADEFGLLVEDLIRPRGYDGEPIVFATALAGAAMVYHDRRLLLSVPDPGQSANTRTYVYDTRLEGNGGGWTRWGFGFTSGCTTSSGTDSDDLYMGGADGQVYTLSGSSDLSGPGASPLPIDCAVTTRGFGLEGGEFWREDDAQRLYVQIAAPAGTVMQQSVGTDYPGRAWTLDDYTLSDNYQQVSSKLTGLVGHYLSASVGWSASAPVRLSGIRLTTAPRGPQTE